MTGGTVDVSAHEVQRNGSLAALSPPSGGPWGGTLVDRHLNDFLCKIFSKPVMDTFSIECKADKLDLDRIMELKKRQLKPEVDETHVKLPIQVFEIYNESNPETPFNVSVRRQVGDSVRQTRDRLHIDTKVLVKMFQESKCHIVRHLKTLLTGSLKDVNTLLLVGGYSESQIIRTAIEKEFPGYDVISPENAELAIVMGMYAMFYTYCFCDTLSFFNNVVR